MRFKLLSVALSVAAALGGCAKVTKEQGKLAFYKELHLYFNNLNNEAQARKDEFRRADVRLGLVIPAGAIYSTFQWNENGLIIRDYPCKTCGTKLLIASPSTEYLCPACGHSPYVTHPAGFNRRESPCKVCITSDGRPKEPDPDTLKKEVLEQAPGARVELMFEFVQDNPQKMVAKVHYVRRQWAFDQRGALDISQKVMDKAAITPDYIPGSPSRAAGFHRLDATFVGEITFEFRGGELTILSRRAEEAVRPWKNMKGGE